MKTLTFEQAQVIYDALELAATAAYKMGSLSAFADFDSTQTDIVEMFPALVKSKHSEAFNLALQAI